MDKKGGRTKEVHLAIGRLWPQSSNDKLLDHSQPDHALRPLTQPKINHLKLVKPVRARKQARISDRVRLALFGVVVREGIEGRAEDERVGFGGVGGDELWSLVGEGTLGRLGEHRLGRRSEGVLRVEGLEESKGKGEPNIGFSETGPKRRYHEETKVKIRTWSQHD